jgi:hypothetical protein
MELMQASRQWATRPADERFTSLTDLYSKTKEMRERANQKVQSSRRLKVSPHITDGDKGIMVQIGDEAPGILSNWSFGQMAGLAGAPTSYLKKLHPALVSDCMNYGLRFIRDSEDVGILTHDYRDTLGELKTDGDIVNAFSISAATGPNYGRIWNEEVVGTLHRKFGDGVTGQWKVPGEFGKDVPVTKDNTTIYGSDRDFFVFLADEKNKVEVANRRNGQPGALSRGFFVSQSEVGSGSLYLAFFLFDYACSNRIVWGAREFKEVRIRHTARAPDRWLEELEPTLIAYSEGAAKPVEETIKAAQEAKLKDDLDDFLKNRKFTDNQINLIKLAHETEEDRPMETIWDVTTGITAYAKGIRNNDDRVAVERQAGRILDLVAA